MFYAMPKLQSRTSEYVGQMRRLQCVTAGMYLILIYSGDVYVLFVMEMQPGYGIYAAQHCGVCAVRTGVQCQCYARQ